MSKAKSYAENGYCPECSRPGSVRRLFFRTDASTNGKVIEECGRCEYKKVVGS